MGAACAGWLSAPRRVAPTTSATGRTVTVSAYEAELARVQGPIDRPGMAGRLRHRQTVELKIVRLMRRKYGDEPGMWVTQGRRRLLPARRYGQLAPP